MKSKSTLGIFVLMIAIVALSVLTYLAQKTIDVSNDVALGVSGVVLISGIACLIIKSNEKRVGILFIGIGFSARSLVAYFLLGFGISRFLSALVGNSLLVVIIVTGFLLSAPLARKLWPTQP
jgi:uncharacterized membrane protein YwaF